MRRLYYGWILIRDIVGYCLANRVVWPLLFHNRFGVPGCPHWGRGSRCAVHLHSVLSGFLKTVYYDRQM